MLLQRNFLSLALAAGVLSLGACAKGGGDFQKTKSGIEYKIFKQVNGKYEERDVPTTGDPTYKDRLGKILNLHIEYRTAKDSTLMSSRVQRMGIPAPFPLDTVKQKGAEAEAFAMLQPGDSAVFRFNADTLAIKNSGRPAPPFIKKQGNTITVLVKADKIQTRDEAMAAQQKMMMDAQQKMLVHAKEQLKKDDVILQDYIKKNNLTAQRDTSGIYYIITQPGKGAKPTVGQTVSVQYKGTLLNGKEFDSSAKGNGGKPIEFVMGVGQVIPGWDKGIALLPEGSKAVLLIPSSLAYGQRGAGADIPADAPLRFDVELAGVKK